MICLKILLLAVATILILALGFPFLIVPTMSMDEGYYITATLKILDGDLFLSSYLFDKGFVHPLMQIPGILFFGKNPLGFKSSGAIFYLGSFIFCVLTLNQILRGYFKRETFLFFLACLIFSLSIYVQPKMIQVGMSTLGEPYLLFFLMATLYLVARSPNSSLNRWISWIFSAALWTKFTAIFWFSILLPSFFTEQIALSRWLKKFFQLSLPLWIVAFLYLLTGHFAAIDLLFHHTNNEISLAEKIGTRLTLMQQSFGGWLSFSLAFLIASSALFLILRSSSHRRNDVLLWLLPFWLQVLFLVAITQKFYDRYYMTLIPYFAFFMAHVLGLIFSKNAQNPRSRILHVAAPYFMVVVSIFFLSQSTSATRNLIQDIQAHTQLGRTLFRLIHEFPDEALIQFEGIEWIMRPYQYLSNARVVHCSDQICQEETRVGRPLRNHHYYVNINTKNPTLLKLPFAVRRSENNSIQGRPEEVECLSPQLHQKILHRGPRALLTKLFERLRITPDFELKSARWTPPEPVPQSHLSIPDLGILELSDSSPNHWHGTESRQQLELEFVLRKWPEHHIRIRGVLDVSSGPVAKSLMMGGETIVGLRISQIRMEPLSLELTDLAPNLYGGYFIPIETLNWTQTNRNSLENLIYDEKRDQYLIKELVVSTNCIP